MYNIYYISKTATQKVNIILYIAENHPISENRYKEKSFIKFS